MKVQTEVRRKFLVVIMVSFVVLFVIVYLFLFRNFNYFFFRVSDRGRKETRNESYVKRERDEVRAFCKEKEGGRVASGSRGKYEL